MAGLQDEWNKTLADAKKILGNSAKIPTGRIVVALKGEQDGINQAVQFGAVRENFAKKILDLQTAWAKVKTALSHADDEISDSDYGLDDSKPDEKKKIEQANALFAKFFESTEKKIDEFLKILGDVDKHMEHMRKFTITKA